MSVGNLAGRVGVSGDNDRLERRLIREALIAAGINMVIGTAVTCFMFGRLVHVPVWGAGGLVVDTIPSTLVPVAMMTLGLSSGMRRGIKSGKVPQLPAGFRRWALIEMLPANLILRSLTLALAAAAIAVPLTALGYWATGAVTLPFGRALALKLVQFALEGLALGPVVVLRVLQE
jgi:hypothetical protein